MITFFLATPQGDFARRRDLHGRTNVDDNRARHPVNPFRASGYVYGYWGPMFLSGKTIVFVC
jgi:hypothetical protein